jgi:large subunit ribosomal protein L22
MKASLKNYRHAPRKVRLIADAIRGKKVSDAILLLSVMPQKAGLPLKKLVESAFANAKQTDPNISTSALKIAVITVDKGITFVRQMPRAMGRATPINRECSHVRLELAKIKEDTVIQPKTATVPAAKKKVAAKKTVKK